MRVRVSDPQLVSDLLDFLKRADCDAIQLGQNMVAVALARALPYETARMELDFRLSEWRARHSGAHAHVID
jgi:hypothetical protein